jgi:hypothetical protein
MIVSADYTNAAYGEAVGVSPFCGSAQASYPYRRIFVVPRPKHKDASKI